MHTQRELLEAALARNGFNWAQLADALDISRAGISKFKYGVPLADETGLKVATLAGLEPTYVLACIAHHRAERLGRTDVLPVWSKIAALVQAAGKQLSAILAAAILAAMFMQNSPARAATCGASFTDRNIPYAKYVAAMLLKILRSASRFFTVAAIIAAAPAHAAGWSRLNIAEESAFQAANLLDWGTTLDMAKRDRAHCAAGTSWAGTAGSFCTPPATSYYESDSPGLLGRVPSPGRTAAYMLASAALHFAVSDLLIETGHPRLEHVWQAITIAEKADAVAGNFSIGLRVTF